MEKKNIYRRKEQREAEERFIGTNGQLPFYELLFRNSFRN